VRAGRDRRAPAAGREADGDQEVAVLLEVLALQRLLAGELDRLVRVRERQAHERRRQGAQAVEQELRVERHGDVLADERGLERLGRLRVVALAGVEHDLAVGERQADRGVPLRDERDALGGVRQQLRVDDRVDRRLVREQPAHGGVVAVDQQGRGVPAAGLEADEVDALAGGEADVDRAGGAERLRGVGERARAHQRDLGDARVGRVPPELAQREAVPVGREQGDLLALDLDADAGQQGQGVVAAGGDRHLGDGAGHLVAVDRARERGHRRQLRVVLDRHGEQGEPAGAAGDGHLGAVELHVDRLVRQRAGDLGEQAARDQHRARLAHVRRDLGARRHLVVEGGEAERAVRLGLDADAGEHRDRRAGGQAASDPRDGFCEDVTFDAELHAPPSRSGGSRGSRARC
jgi:hypothetical protein